MVAAGSRVLEAQRLIFVRDAGKQYRERRSSRLAMFAVNAGRAVGENNSGIPFRWAQCLESDMWTRIYKFRANRRLEELSQLVDKLCGEVGWLQGEHVVFVSAGTNRGVLRIRFFKHSDWCSCNLADHPNKPIKQALRWIRRYCR